MMQPSPYAELPIMIGMPGGFSWYLAERHWEGAARLANGLGGDKAEILKRAILRYRRYGPQEVGNLLEASRGISPVRGLRCRGCLLL